MKNGWIMTFALVAASMWLQADDLGKRKIDKMDMDTTKMEMPVAGRQEIPTKMSQAKKAKKGTKAKKITKNANRDKMSMGKIKAAPSPTEIIIAK